MRRMLLFLSAAVTLTAQFPEGEWKTDTSRKNIDLRELLRGGPPKDGIPSVDKPNFIPASEASWLPPKELVISVAMGGVARAYPLQILIWHELVNDVIGEKPILVSYCPLCNSAIVFDRALDGETLEFGVSGMLRNSDMVMYDRQTDSLWQQITGEAIVGTHTGRQLGFLPSQMIPFEQFQASYADGVVLSRQTGFQRDYGRNPYRGYEFGSGPIMPVRQAGPSRIGPMEKLVVMRHGKGYRAYTVKALARKGFWEDKIDDRYVVLFYSPEGLSPVDAANMAESRSAGSVGVFLAERDGKRIRFQKTKGGEIQDRETGSTWSITGLATAGERKNARLTPIKHGLYFAFAWLAFEPETYLIGADPPPIP